MDPDEAAYRRSVRNMAAILAAIVITVFAAIFVPLLLFPTHNVYPASVTYDSPSGFAMHLALNKTADSAAWTIVLTGWINSTSPSIENVSASDSWAIPRDALWTMPCNQGWPIGLGVMQGHYTQDNFTLGTLLSLDGSTTSCPAQTNSPSSFTFEPQTAKALVVLDGKPSFWVLQTSLRFTGTTPGHLLQPGVYTAVLADEWGDVLTANFLEP